MPLLCALFVRVELRTAGLLLGICQTQLLAFFDFDKTNPHNHNMLTALSSPLLLLPRRYQPIRLIGSGAYGLVCSALDRKTGKEVAIKKITRVSNNKQPSHGVRFCFGDVRTCAGAGVWVAREYECGCRYAGGERV